MAALVKELGVVLCLTLKCHVSFVVRVVWLFKCYLGLVKEQYAYLEGSSVPAFGGCCSWNDESRGRGNKGECKSEVGVHGCKEGQTETNGFL